MLVLATLILYDPAIHGGGGPDGHFLIDATWTRRDAFRQQLYRRAERHGLRIDLVEPYQEGLYSVGLVNPALKIFQRRLKRRYGIAAT
jgi:hypothetical protein